MAVQPQSLTFRTCPQTGQDVYKRQGFDSVDLNLYSFCGKDHNAMDSFPMAEDGWRDWARYVGECAEKAGVVVGQAHAPQFCMMPQDGSYREPEEIFYRAIEACKLMGTPHLVLSLIHI